ncbi:MAG: HDIG domain-containing metalloprotein [Planctomycetota bacterium]
MSNSSSQRSRWTLPEPKAPIQKVMEFLGRADVWTKIGICLASTLVLYSVMFGWEPAFPYRIRQAPTRDLHAHTSFKYVDYRATADKRDRIRRNFLCFYANDPQPLEQLRQALIEAVFKVKQNTYEELQETSIWAKFFPQDVNGQQLEPPDEESFNQFREALAADEKLSTLHEAVKKAFLEIDKNGLLEDLTHEFGQGNMQEIEVFPKGNFEDRRRVTVSEVRIAEVVDVLRQRLMEELGKESTIITDSNLVAQRVFDWLKPQLPATLTWDEPKSKEGAMNAVGDVENEFKVIEPGDLLEQENSFNLERRGLLAGIPLNREDIELLQAEHQALIASETFGPRAIRTLMFFGFFAVLFSMISQYLYFRDRNLLDDLSQFGLLIGLFTVSLAIAWVLAIRLEWRAEIVPITIFSMTIVIAYNMELALLLGMLCSLAFTVFHGFGLAEFVILTTAASAAATMCRTIRSRTKLVNVGLIVAAIVFPTVVGVEYLLGQPLSTALTTDALWFAGGVGIAGLVMTALLPFLERWFDIQTDISLLELTDANHPLLKELVQRAPGTYNHSINVASLSEAAAEAIGANGLLCRVGACFHDVGKMRKPEYFIENQGGGVNKHDDLVPTMSTLVIIAHVKDGADIAKKHRLPQRIIDLIEEHHGTTLVEYFYRRATQQQVEQDSEESPIDEADFRYPGPKPQSRESVVMMLADSVESASRALREPAPARIENLVREVARKKLDDGQFDECDITLEELNTIQESLIKSLNAMYHARVKYPEQQTA